jgi:hypothetical protein
VVAWGYQKGYAVAIKDLLREFICGERTVPYLDSINV